MDDVAILLGDGPEDAMEELAIALAKTLSAKGAILLLSDASEQVSELPGEVSITRCLRSMALITEGLVAQEITDPEVEKACRGSLDRVASIMFRFASEAQDREREVSCLRVFRAAFGWMADHGEKETAVALLELVDEIWDELGSEEVDEIGAGIWRDLVSRLDVENALESIEGHLDGLSDLRERYPENACVRTAWADAHKIAAAKMLQAGLRDDYNRLARRLGLPKD